MHTMTNDTRRKNAERDKGKKKKQNHTIVIVLASVGGLLLIGGVVCWLRFGFPNGESGESQTTIIAPILFAIGGLCCISAGLVGLYFKTKKSNAIQDVKPANAGTTVTLSKGHGHYGNAGYGQSEGGYGQYGNAGYGEGNVDHNPPAPPAYEEQQAPFDSPYDQSGYEGGNDGGDNNYDNNYYGQSDNTRR